jgi:hypothetical protein
VLTTIFPMIREICCASSSNCAGLLQICTDAARGAYELVRDSKRTRSHCEGGKEIEDVAGEVKGTFVDIVRSCRAFHADSRSTAAADWFDRGFIAIRRRITICGQNVPAGTTKRRTVLTCDF